MMLVIPGGKLAFIFASSLPLMLAINMTQILALNLNLLGMPLFCTLELCLVPWSAGPLLTRFTQATGASGSRYQSSSLVSATRGYGYRLVTYTRYQFAGG